jgi:hypothetical protein
MAAILASALLLTGCPGGKAPAKLDKPVAGAEDNTRDPQWVSQHTPRAQVAIVFVHGIFGDTLGTWTYSRDTSFFQLLNSDPKLAAPVDLFAFGYTSKMMGQGSFTIDEPAQPAQ